ncbi:phosphoesterase, MJ0936 family [Clostridium cavendishii DSM 21758]|uniref:Phosphoesterase n=1 Tax=Clostridium cavendishii DSM 21758 TaxID=1121302 RepID=A0A1M6CYT9_9CLOT|nr:metallophosphoesterase family protein [Clostridium cavendishii]SHI66043.1 phosphoesterase, MJ0936 family [Clostridium cavendishii DSM 21758]
MKIAIVSDIHGNLVALNRFLKVIDEEKIETILNLGDFIGGLYPIEVLNIIKDDKRFISVLGNHDELHRDYILEEAGIEAVKFINSIPLNRIIEICNKKILMVHSSEKSNMDIPVLFTGKSLEEFVESYDKNVDIVLFGHTHLQCFITYYGDRIIINPGSLGLSYDGNESFLIIDFKEGGVDYIFKKLNI